MTEAKKGPSGAAAGVGASLPVLFALVGCCTLPLATGGDYDGFEHRIQEAGIWFWAVLGCAALGGLVAAVLVLLAGRGMRVPVALPIFFAALPWLAGLAGTAAGMNMVKGALAFADASQRSMMLAAGISEATIASAMGAWIGAALLAGVAVGLGICAVGQRAPGRSGLGALVGVASALPMLGIAVWVTLAMPPTGAILVLPALGAMIACGVAAAGAGKDEPHRRSAALAAGAPIAIGLAFVATAIAVHTGWLIEGFGALASVGSESRGSILVAMAQDLVPAQLASTWGALAALLPVLGVGGWAAMRGGLSGGRVAGGVAAILVAAILPASHAAVSSYTRDAMAGVGNTPWAQVASFQPISIPGDGYCEQARVTVSPDGLRVDNGGAVSVTDAAAVANALRPALDPVPSDDYVIAPPDEHTPRLAVAIDASVTAGALRAFAEHARAAGARSLCVVGTRGEGVTAAERAIVERNAPLLAPFVQSFGGVEVAFVDPNAAAEDPVLYHATVTGPGTVTLTPRAGATATPIELAPPSDPYGFAERMREGDAAYVALGDGATAGDWVVAAAHAAQLGLDPVIVIGAMPGSPDQVTMRTSLGDTATDLAGVLRDIGQPATPRGADPVVRGSLSRDVIQRVIRGSNARIRHCYEQELARNPTLTARVDVRFVIGADGAVTSATAEGDGMPQSMVSCVESVARSLRFPAPEGGGVVAVNYPFVFQPG